MTQAPDQRGFQAVILAGGLGTRIRSVAAGRPKALLPVAGRPFIDLVLEQLQQQGFRRVAMALGYKAEMVREHLGDGHGDIALSYHLEDSPLGTGGAIAAACRLLEADPFFALNGDSWVQVDYSAMWAAHQRKAADVTLAAVAVDDVGRYGALELENTRVVGFCEKGGTGPGAINAGVYLIRRETFQSRAPAGAFSFERDYLQSDCNSLKEEAFMADGPFIDIGVPKDLARAPAVLKPA